MELGQLFYTIALSGMDEFQDDVRQTEGQTETSSNKMIEYFKKIGAAVATYFTVQSIINFGQAVVDAAATVSAETSAFEQIMGDYSNTAQAKMHEVADATGVVDTRLTTYMTSMTAKFKGLGFDIEDATTLASDGLTLASDAAAFWDKSLDDSMSSLNSFINGSYEGGEAIGLFANDTQMAQFAIKQGIVDSTNAWSNLDEATKQATRLEYAKQMYEQSGATGQAAKEADQYANVQANLTEKWRQFKAQIGEPILQNIVLPAMKKLSDLVDKASEAMQFLSEHSTTVKGVLITLGTAIGIVTTALTMQAIVQATKAAMNAAEVTTLGALIAAKWADAAATMAALAPYLLIAAAIAAVIAIIVLLVKNWDKVKEVAISVWESIKATWESVADWFKTSVIDPLINFFTGLWENITTIWETIKSVIQVALMFIVSLVEAAFDLITLPWQFIWENCGDTLTNIWNTIKQCVSNAIDSISETITNVMSSMKTFWNTTWTAISDFLEPIIEGIRTFIDNAFNQIKSTIDSILNAIKNVVSSVWNAIKTFMTNTINGIKNTVTSVFNAIKSAIETPLNSAKSSVTNIFNGIKTTISNVITSAKNTVSNGLNAIKGFFNALKLKFPNIKLPHFSIKGSFSLKPPSVPTLGIDWYAKGGIMTEPTIFGYNPETGKMKVGGEAGAEAVAPIETLLGYVKTAVAEENSALADAIDNLIAMLAEYLPLILNKNSQLVLDTGVLVGETANVMNDELGNIYDRNRRGG